MEKKRLIYMSKEEKIMEIADILQNTINGLLILEGIAPDLLYETLEGSKRIIDICASGFPEDLK